MYFMEQFLIFQLNLPPDDSHKETHRDHKKFADPSASANIEGSALKESCCEELRKDAFIAIKNLCSLRAVWKLVLSFASPLTMVPSWRAANICAGSSCLLFTKYDGNTFA